VFFIFSRRVAKYLGKIITVTSGKGGTGKTASTSAISSCLAAIGYKTLCIDLDVGLRNLDIALGMTNYAITDFADVLDGNMTLAEASHEHPDIKGLFFLSAPVGRDIAGISAQAVTRMCAQARETFDFCLIDSPAGIGPGFKLAAQNADEAIIVAVGDSVSLRAAQTVATLLVAEGVREIRLLVNRVRPRRYKRLGTTVDDVIDTVGAQLIGIVAEDESVTMAGATNTPLVLYSDGKASRQFLNIARLLSGEHVHII
jgi:septum site-determining protein MinD